MVMLWWHSSVCLSVCIFVIFVEFHGLKLAISYFSPMTELLELEVRLQLWVHPEQMN